MRAYVAVTDRGWYDQLRHAGELDEVNLWQPSAGRGLKALEWLPVPDWRLNIVWGKATNLPKR